ncbi:MAG: efflux transporter outer membrane subunit [Chthoniobacterales bacterium]
MRTILPLVRLALPAILLAGCVIGPRYYGPPAAESEAPAHFKGELNRNWKIAQPGGRQARVDWWRIFGEPGLDRLEVQALAANQDLRVATARIQESRAQTRAAAADFYPSLALDARGQRTRTSNTLPFQRGKFLGNNPFGMGGGTTGGAPPVITNQPLTTTQNDFRVPAELSWELDLFGRVRQQYRAARAEAEAIEADFQGMRLSVTANVAASYFMLRAADSERAVIEQALKGRREGLRIANERLQAGLTSELDVARAQADLAANEAALLGLERSRAEMENALATLIGQPASEVRIAPQPLREGRVPRIPAGLPSELLERRPDVARAERELAAANAHIGIARAAFFPQIRLTGTGGFESADLGLLFNPASRFWQIGPSIHLPIFDGGRNLANLRVTQAQYEEALARFRGQVLIAFQEVETALSESRTLSGEAEAQGRVAVAAERALELSRQSYEKGAVNFLDVLDAERTLLQTQRTQAQLSGRQVLATLQLIKALGGDWD